MRTLLNILMVLCAASVALAADTGNKRVLTPKGSAHVRTKMAYDKRDGGETAVDPVVIGGLPYSDSGATCDNIDDYDEACPYPFSNSPDVVYAWTPPANMPIQIDLCGSEYDTKLYENAVTPETLIACNEDFYFENDPCGEFNAAIFNLQVYAGNTYFIVVDGYDGDCGAYEIFVDEFIFIPSACTPACPYNGISEAEPDLTTGYVDVINAGCNVPAGEPIFQHIEGWDGFCGTVCANSGWYDVDFRDTDWYFVQAGDYEISFSVYADYGVTIQHLDIPDCDSIQLLHWASGSCEWVNITFATFPGELHYLTVLPDGFDPPEGAPEDFTFRYTAEVCGISAGPVAVDDPPRLDRPLIRAYPNPFNPMTTITYVLPHESPVSLKIYDVSGRAVSTIEERIMPAGEHSGRWNGRDHRGAEVPSGVYFARLVTADGIQIEKLALVR